MLALVGLQVGVFQGKLFIALAGFSHPAEAVMAADWWRPKLISSQIASPAASSVL